MIRQTLAVAIIASLAPLSKAIRAFNADLDEDIFSGQNYGDDSQGGLEEIPKDESTAEALYYDPNEQVIYEILTDEELAAE